MNFSLFSNCRAVLACVILSVSAAGIAATPHATLPSDQPKYILSLNLGEFSMLNNALVTGLAGGGSVEMMLTVANYPQAGGPQWVISVQNPAVLQALSVWTAKELMSVVEQSDLQNLDAATVDTMAAIKSLAGKVDAAQKSPVWPDTTLEGEIAVHAGSPVLQTSSTLLRLALNTNQTSTPAAGTKVLVNGFIRQPGEIVVEALAPVTTDTLHVFTMSQCPYGQQVVPLLAKLVRDKKATGEATPKLEVRFIFYRSSEDPNAEYFCLHGEPELQENLVQMLIRDRHPEQFLEYLLARFTNPDAPWRALAEQVGLQAAQIEAMDQAMQNDRQRLIGAEYAYVHDLYGVEDKSPTYMWQGKVIDSPAEAEGFADFDTANVPSGSCSQ